MTDKYKVIYKIKLTDKYTYIYSNHETLKKAKEYKGHITDNPALPEVWIEKNGVRI